MLYIREGPAVTAGPSRMYSDSSSQAPSLTGGLSIMAASLRPGSGMRVNRRGRVRSLLATRRPCGKKRHLRGRHG
jgi:hypothetical protein